jgi:nitroreductase
MMFRDLVEKARSYRRFYASHTIADETLLDMIDIARITPSAANRQPIRYFYSNTALINEKIFPCLNWAGYLLDWEGPAEDERPSAYIMILTDSQFSSQVSFDQGIVAQTIQLSATERGLGACMIASFDKNKLKKAVDLPSDYEILLVIAIGKPNEKVVLLPVPMDGSIQYFRDDQSIHYVPKRKLEDVIVSSQTRDR